MTDPKKLFGRLGNSMFQGAFLYAFCHDNGTDPWFQDERWFAKYKDEVIKMYSEGIGFIDKVAIHIRRGDYLNPPLNTYHTNLCETDYYQRAMPLFPDEKFLIFCKDRQDPEQDKKDKEWCLEHFPNCEFWESEDEIADMNTMASCKGHIIANSSFSWWASYLSPNGGKVVAPKEETWFCDGVVRTKLPANFIQI